MALAGLLSCLPLGASAQPASFERTGSMSTVRFQHTATLLPDGRVLVTGGSQYYFPTAENYPAGQRPQNVHISLPPDRRALASAEVYQPTTGTWTATDAMRTARCGHTATLLSNGLILVAGGWSFPRPDGNPGVEAVASAELYDPTTGRWTPTGEMRAGRGEHTATRLLSGKVLVTGGHSTSGSAPLASAEIYDPATRQWKLTGTTGIARGGATATLLPDGRVLLAGGGAANGSLLSSAELFEPKTGTWTPTGSMKFPRAGSISELLKDGRVIVAGGRPGSMPPYRITTAEL